MEVCLNCMKVLIKMSLAHHLKQYKKLNNVQMQRTITSKLVYDQVAGNAERKKVCTICDSGYLKIHAMQSEAEIVSKLIV